jgi:hypothetical protein
VLQVELYQTEWTLHVCHEIDGDFVIEFYDAIVTCMILSEALTVLFALRTNLLPFLKWLTISESQHH